jgi:hypothetical protein
LAEILETGFPSGPNAGAKTTSLPALCARIDDVRLSPSLPAKNAGGFSAWSWEP